MKIGVIKRIVKESLPAGTDGLPTWLEGVLQPLNNFIEQVGTALKNKLTFEDNFLCTIVQQNITSGVEQLINPQSNFRVIGVQLMDANGAMIDRFRWRRIDKGGAQQIGVTLTFDGTTESKCKFIIFLG